MAARTWLHPESQHGRLFASAFKVLLVSAFAYLFSRGPLLVKDSPTYIEGSHITSPVYPFFLLALRSIFHGGFLWAAVFLQLAIGLVVILRFARRFVALFSLPPVLEAAVSLILVLPYFGSLRFGNAVMSEALAYPLFLLTMGPFFQALVDGNSRSLLRAFFWAALLILTRKQFVFLYILFALAVALPRALAGSAHSGETEASPLGSASVRQPSSASGLIAAVYLALLVATATVAERLVQFARDGRFAPIPFTGFQVVTAPLFLSTGRDSMFIEGGEGELFRRLYPVLEERRALLRSEVPADLHLLPVDRYYAVYNLICWGALKPVSVEMGLEDWYELDELTTSLALQLIRLHLREYLRLIRWVVQEGAGGTAILLFYLILLLVSSGLYLRAGSTVALVTAAATAAHLGNLALIAVAEPILLRYTAYTLSLELCILLALAYRGIAAERR